MASEFLQDLGTALNIFNQGAEKLALTQTLDQANQQVRSIQKSAESEAKKRSALNSLADQIALQLTQVGATPQAVAQASQAIGAKLPGSAEDAVLRGMLLNEPDSLAVGTALLSGKNKEDAPQKLTMGEVETLAGFEEAEGVLTSLMSKARQNSRLVGPNALSRDRISLLGLGQARSAEVAGFDTELAQLTNAVRKAVTGAGASQQEIDNIIKDLPQGGDFEANFFSKSQALLEDLRRRKETRINLLRQSGRDTSDIEAARMFGKEQSKSSVRNAVKASIK